MTGALDQQHPVPRLDEEIGGAGVVGGSHRLIAFEAGQHHHRQPRQRGVAADGAAHRESVGARHHGVDQNDVDWHTRQRFEERVAASVFEHHQAGSAQRRAGKSAPAGLVIGERHRYRPRIIRTGGCCHVGLEARRLGIDLERHREPSSGYT
jgi:hypothetical protein